MVFRRRSFALLGVCAYLACVSPSAAQSISGRVVVYGRVVDASTGDPVAGALVFSVDSTTTVLADSLGAFAIPLGAAGPLAVYAQQFGYLSQRFDLEAFAPSRLMVLRLEPAPFELEELTVTAEAALARLVRGVEARANAYGFGPVASLDRTRLERYGGGATVLDVIRTRAPRITECYDGTNGLCTRSRWVSFRSAYPQVQVEVCVDELRSFSPLNELSNLSIESIARVEIFGRSSVRVYTTAWMLRQARRGHTNVLPLWMGC